MRDYMKESLRLLNENIDLNAKLVRCRLKLKQAEGDLKRLQKSYAITNESWKKQVEELANLRKVADAARGVFLGEGEYFCSEFEDAMDRLEQSLAELDKEGER